METELTLSNMTEQLLIIPDVHGEFDLFCASVTLLRDRMHAICLGDIVDRGDYSPLCAELLLDELAAGRMSFVPGNHDIALCEVIAGLRTATPERERTLAQFREHGGNTLDRFCDAVMNAPLARTFGHLGFVHAAWSEEMTKAGNWSADLRKLALRGEAKQTPEKKRPQVSYQWAEKVPSGRTVFVGHDNRGGDFPHRVQSRAGGEVFFLDTGCGSGGPLHCAIVDLGSDDVQIIEIKSG